MLVARRGLPIVRPPIAIGLVVEGEKREARYFEQAVLNRTCVASWTLHSANGGDPTSLYTRALEIAKDLDQVFIVADADRCPPNCSESEAENWERLRELCTGPDFHLILTFPCVEAWFLMHFTDDFPSVPLGEPGTYSSFCDPFKQELKIRYPKLDQRPVEDWANLRPLLADAVVRSRASTSKKLKPAVWSEMHLLMKELGHC